QPQTAIGFAGQWSGGNMLSAVQSARDVHAGLLTDLTKASEKKYSPEELEKSLFKVSRARARQGENEPTSGMVKWCMSISRMFSTPYRRSAADFEQVLRNAGPAPPCA
uniref:hypothetical protein n=1 Tax=Chromobacterium haemolyticum TaxID=394935 RepID=UPI0013B37421